LDWNASLYQQRHSFVWKSGEDLLALLRPEPGERVLDIGCGTGALSAQIAGAGARVTGLDKSATMLEQARAAYPAIEFLEADICEFEPAEPYDAIFSNAALHWVKPPEAAARRMYEALKPGGRLVLEMGGAGNVGGLLAAAGALLGEKAENPWYFPALGEYAALLEDAGFEVTYALLFDRVTPLEGGEAGFGNWLEMFAPAWRASLLTPLTELVRPRYWNEQAGEWRMDYRRLRMAARRPQ